MQKKDILTTTGIIAALIMGMVTAFFSDTKTTTDDVTVLKPQFEELKKDFDGLKGEFNDWQTNGELPLDVEQNGRLGFLEEFKKDTKKIIDEFRERLRKLETNQHTHGDK